MILEHVGAGRELIENTADRPGHDYRYAVDPTPAESLGWQRAWTLDDGLRDTVRWYADNRAWWEKIKSGSHYQQHDEEWYAGRTAVQA